MDSPQEHLCNGEEIFCDSKDPDWSPRRQPLAACHHANCAADTRGPNSCARYREDTDRHEKAALQTSQEAGHQVRAALRSSHAISQRLAYATGNSAYSATAAVTGRMIPSLTRHSNRMQLSLRRRGRWRLVKSDCVPISPGFAKWRYSTARSAARASNTSKSAQYPASTIRIAF